MTISRTWSICGLGAALLIAGCDEGGGGGGGDGSAPTMDGATAGMDGAAGSTDGGGTPLDGMALTEAGTPAPVMCQAHLYQCGDGVDNDGDGLIDWQDPDCLGPCDNNEGGFYLNIPGGDAQPCALECYFDQDEGVGNDGCQWDHRCDPLEPDQNALCRYMPPPRRPGITCPDTQTEMCARVCGPLVPNGCDCFGCCNLPAGGDRWVFIGSVDGAGNPTCDLASVNDDAACHPCTPVPGCLNECGRCELCLGRSTLPADCYPPPEPDGGYTPPPETCSDPSRQSCGLPEHPPCPDGQYCLTGCCTFFG
ncbi:MAG: hypothetical protein KF729_36730 [Sandaracinaceae bacterium]|nr:hypothetical protein [Sandaracinaceae bacterium]